MLVDNKFQEAINCIAKDLKERILAELPLKKLIIQEIRLIKGSKPLLLTSQGIVYISGIITTEELNETLLAMTNNSLHTYQRDMATGFIPLKGGHRAGVCGTAVYGNDKEIKAIRELNAIVIRIAHQFENISKNLISTLFSKGLCGVLIAGAPGSGKTTILREIATKLSSGAVKGCSSVVIVDERAELSLSGERCCVLKGYDKADGIMQAVRSLSPQVIICDEIGTQKDVDAVIWALNCGVYVITSIHARTRQELKKRKAGEKLLATHAFEKVVFLSSVPIASTITEVVNIDELY